jgi:NAD+ synthase/NAD+ synthase (glutamine-hydrolysing)
LRFIRYPLWFRKLTLIVEIRTNIGSIHFATGPAAETTLGRAEQPVSSVIVYWLTTTGRLGYLAAHKGSAMKIALVQFNPVIGDFKHQCRRIVALAEKAKTRGCDLAVFPEMAVCGYPPKDLLDRTSFVEANRRTLDYLVNTVGGIGILLGYVAENPDPSGKPLLNGAVLFEDGHLLHQVHKQLLPTYDVFDERRHFEPGRPDLPYLYKGHRLGVTICEDVWNDKDVFANRLYDVDPIDYLAKNGMDVLINIAASPFHIGKVDFRDHMLSTIAAKHQLPVLFVNQVGGNDQLLFDGASTVFSADGRVLARAEDFVEDLIVFDTQRMHGDMHHLTENRHDSVFKALVMGTRDYVTKCGFKTAVIGLSGGIDSALTACIAAEALGAENVSTVFMPSAYTSQENFEDTRQLARNLGLGYTIIPIDDIFGQFLHLLVPQADGADPGLTEQNIQARIRGTLLMGISNRDGCLVLSTGNKSELAVGYCTLYGDMNGGLAVISDVPKTMVYHLCRRINRKKEVIPQRIIDKPPSAELKPDQTDQDDLPPYEIIDPILEGYVEKSQSVHTLVDAGFDPTVVKEVIRRVDQNEYKRHQAAPGLKVTPKAFGEGRRYPLAKRFRPIS